MTHEVMLLCDCPNIERCEMERYASDIRILFAELERCRAERQPSAPIPQEG